MTFVSSCSWSETPRISFLPSCASNTSYHLLSTHSFWAGLYGKQLSILSHVILTSPLREGLTLSNLIPPTSEETAGRRDEVTCLNSHGQKVATKGLEQGLPDTEAPPTSLCGPLLQEALPSTEAWRHRGTRTNTGVPEDPSGAPTGAGRPLAPLMTTWLSDSTLNGWQHTLTTQQTQKKLS